MARDSCLARVIAEVTVGGAIGNAVGVVYGTYEAIRYLDSLWDSQDATSLDRRCITFGWVSPSPLTQGWGSNFLPHQGMGGIEDKDREIRPKPVPLPFLIFFSGISNF
ncbi:hypothetical protein DITRI_Ditri06bG0078200 [Diplodiscus trichospermus]